MKRLDLIILSVVPCGRDLGRRARRHAYAIAALEQIAHCRRINQPVGGGCNVPAIGACIFNSHSAFDDTRDLRKAD